MTSLTCRIQEEMIQMNLFTKQKQTHRPKKMNLWLPAGGRGKDSQGVWDGHVHSAVFKMHNLEGPTISHMEL